MLSATVAVSMVAAIAAGPLFTTIDDIISIGIYYVVASALIT